MDLNQQLACMIVNFVVRRFAQHDRPIVEIERRYGDLMLLHWAYQASFDGALASTIEWIDSLTYDERFRLFYRAYLEARRTPQEKQDDGFQFACRWTRAYVLADPQLFAANIDEAWQRLRERLVGGLRHSGFPYQPVTDEPMPSDG